MTTIKPSTIIRKINTLRSTIQSQGTPEIQAAWDNLEPHVSIFLNAEKINGPSGKNGKDGARSGNVGQPGDRPALFCVQVRAKASKAEAPNE